VLLAIGGVMLDYGLSDGTSVKVDADLDRLGRLIAHWRDTSAVKAVGFRRCVRLCLAWADLVIVDKVVGQRQTVWCGEVPWMAPVTPLPMAGIPRRALLSPPAVPGGRGLIGVVVVRWRA
jgi:hypothetical protein